MRKKKAEIMKQSFVTKRMLYYIFTQTDSLKENLYYKQFPQKKANIYIYVSYTYFHQNRKNNPTS